MTNQRNHLILILILALLSSTLSSYLFSTVDANPFLYEQVDSPVAPLQDIEPPTISVIIPANNSQTFSKNLSIDFRVFVDVPILPELFYYWLVLDDVYYKASWLPNSTHLASTDIHYIPTRSLSLSNESLLKWGTDRTLSPYTLSPKFSINLTDIPPGEHSIEIHATERGSREVSQSGNTISYGRYTLDSSSIIRFTIEELRILSPENSTKYDTSEVPLTFKNNYNSSYSNYFKLDNGDNQSIDGNITLWDLPNGEHNVTVYAIDNKGDTEASEIVNFSIDVPEPSVPFPLWIMATVAMSAIAIFAIGLFYFKRAKISKREQF